MGDRVYCYPNSDVLKNRKNIRDKKRLFDAEIRYTGIRLIELQKHPIDGNFEFKHLCKIHHHIFRDLYDWAGKPRIVNIAKKSLFCLSQHIYTYADTIFPNYYRDCKAIKSDIELFVHTFTRYYADLNALHPFREGNGRAQREFARELCLQCGYVFDLTKTNHKEMLTASIESLDKGDNTNLEIIFKRCITPLSD